MPSCEICQIHFTREDNLKRHVRNTHPLPQQQPMRGSLELGHGIRIDALEYNGEPRIDIRTWEKSAQGKGMCHSLSLGIHSMVKCRCNP